MTELTNVEMFEKIQLEAFELFKKKNADYGDAFEIFGPIGVIIRIFDKMNRLKTLSKDKIEIKTESIRDTLLDLHNYSAICIMLLDKQGNLT